MRSVVEHPCEVAIALWFHDAVYDPRGRDNEARSAAWSAAAMREHEAAADVAERVQQMILATSHSNTRQTGDAALLVDIDLSILGAAAETYDAYAAEIRREYAWVPPADYASGRSNVLRSFLERESIYQTPIFR